MEIIEIRSPRDRDASGYLGHSSPADQMKLSCSGYNPLETMFKDVCWSGMFPMKPAGATMIPGKSGEPADRTNKIICACGGDLTKGQLPRIGFTVGLGPAKILDVTRRPYCLPSLGGMELPFASINFLNRFTPC